MSIDSAMRYDLCGMRRPRRGYGARSRAAAVEA